jgi:hypothetical protein
MKGWQAFAILLSALPLIAAENTSTPGSHVTLSLVSSPNTLSSPICGTWALLTVGSATYLPKYKTLIQESLSVPKIAGFSIRAPWTSIVSDLSIYDSSLQIAQSYKVKLAIRFVSGTSTPSQFLGNSVVYAGSGKLMPLPWAAGSTPSSFVPNATFESGYAATVKQLAAWARAHGVQELHLPWYSGPSDEIYLGPEILAAPGYSMQNFLTGYERLINIGRSVAGPDLTVEFPMSGVYLAKVAPALEQYIVATYGSYPANLITQWNNLSDTSPAKAAYGVNIGRQMIGKGDYDWTAIYKKVIGEHSRTVEVYLQSFAPTMPRVKVLRQEIATFAGVC